MREPVFARESNQIAIMDGPVVVLYQAFQTFAGGE